MVLDNAVNIAFAGVVSGYTNLMPLNDEMKFTNGVTIYSNSIGANPEYISYKQDGKEILRLDGGTWSIKDSEAGAVRSTVFVDGTMGVDSNAGTSRAPVDNLANAYRKAAEIYNGMKNMTKEVLAGLSADEKTLRLKVLAEGMEIVILDNIVLGDIGNLSLETQMPKVTVRAVGGDKAILFSDDSYVYTIPVYTVIENTVMESTCSINDPVIYANGKKLEIAQGVVTRYIIGKPFSVFGGGEQDITVEGNDLATDLTVMSGEWDAIYGGSPSNKINGSVNLTVGGSTEANYVFGGGQYPGSDVNGDVTLTIIGGSYQDVYGSGESASVTGRATTVFQYGSIANLYGGGYEKTSVTGNTVVIIGEEAGSGNQAVITGKFRGSGQRGEMKAGGLVQVTVNNSAHIMEGVEFCAGGYSGTVPKAVLYIKGGQFETNIFAGG